MGDHAKKNESEPKVNVVPIEMALLEDIAALHKRNQDLEKRIDRMDCKWDALVRRLEGLERHPEDEGWFD